MTSYFDKPVQIVSQPFANFVAKHSDIFSCELYRTVNTLVQELEAYVNVKGLVTKFNNGFTKDEDLKPFFGNVEEVPFEELYPAITQMVEIKEEHIYLRQPLADLLQKPYAQMIQRSEIERALIDYCRSNQLFHGKYVHPNAELIELFNLEDRLAEYNDTAEIDTNINNMMWFGNLDLFIRDMTFFIKPVEWELSDELCALLGEPIGTKMQRHVITSKLYEYCKRHELVQSREPGQSRPFTTTPALRKVLQLTINDELTFMNLQKHLSKAIRKVAVNEQAVI